MACTVEWICRPIVFGRHAVDHDGSLMSPCMGWCVSPWDAQWCDPSRSLGSAATQSFVTGHIESRGCGICLASSCKRSQGVACAAFCMFCSHAITKVPFFSSRGCGVSHAMWCERSHCDVSVVFGWFCSHGIVCDRSHRIAWRPAQPRYAKNAVFPIAWLRIEMRFEPYDALPCASCGVNDTWCHRWFCR